MAYAVRLPSAPNNYAEFLTPKDDWLIFKTCAVFVSFRGLDFTSQAMSNNIKSPSEELSTSFRTAYSNTLKPHHSILLKPVFSAAMSATPYRKDFYKKLGDDQEAVDRQLKEWLSGLQETLIVLKKDLFELNKKWKV